jgi:hypothetical protein
MPANNVAVFHACRKTREHNDWSWGLEDAAWSAFDLAPNPAGCLN